MYEYHIQVGIAQVGPDNRLKPGSAVDLLQNGSFFEMNTNPWLMDYFAEKRLGCFIVSRQLDVRRMPSYGEHLTVRVWVYSVEKFWGHRNTMLYDERGEVCIASSTMGSFVSLETGRPARLSQEVLDRYPTEPPYPMEVLPRRIKLPDAAPEPLEPVHVANSHIDCYGHMNNARYVDLAANCLPPAPDIRRLRVEYKRAAKLGERITPVLYRAGDISTVSLEVDGAPAAVVEFLLPEE